MSCAAYACLVLVSSKHIHVARMGLDVDRQLRMLSVDQVEQQRGEWTTEELGKLAKVTDLAHSLLKLMYSCDVTSESPGKPQLKCYTQLGTIQVS